ncbi:Hypothetical protein POVR2_LOCUS283 [uncultured virus]|nr:Hypothetical protein POVR2_LOCUS283 [uncultured virus]
MNSIPIDINFHICSLLDDETLQTVYLVGLIPHLSQLASNQLWWHARVELLTERQVAISQPDVDWQETYYILKRKLELEETPIFWNKEDNTTALDILQDMFVPNTIDLCAAAARGSLKILAWLLQDIELDPSAMSIEATYALHLAAENGQYEAVEMLLADSRTNPDQYTLGNTPLSLACKAKHEERSCSYVKIVTMLLTNERVDPTHAEDTALYVACKYPGDNVDVVDLLLADGRPDPTRKRTGVLIDSVSRGHTKTVARLLQDPRVDPTVANNLALRTALVECRVAEVKLLLSDNRVLDSIKHRELDEYLAFYSIEPELAQLVRDALTR